MCHCEKELSHFSGLHQCHRLMRNKEKRISLPWKWDAKNANLEDKRFHCCVTYSVWQWLSLWAGTRSMFNICFSLSQCYPALWILSEDRARFQVLLTDRNLVSWFIRMSITYLSIFDCLIKIHMCRRSQEDLQCVELSHGLMGRKLANVSYFCWKTPKWFLDNILIKKTKLPYMIMCSSAWQWQPFMRHYIIMSRCCVCWLDT